MFSATALLGRRFRIVHTSGCSTTHDQSRHVGFQSEHVYQIDTEALHCHFGWVDYPCCWIVPRALQGVHELLPQPSEVLYITLLRDPVTRTTSGLNYNRVVKAQSGLVGIARSLPCVCMRSFVELTVRLPHPTTGGGESIRNITASGKHCNG